MNMRNIMLNIRNKRLAILTLIALAAVATIALADVIFVYTGTVNVKPMSTSPLVFATGPNAGPTNTAAEPFINFTGTNSGFTVSLVITNSSAVYYYEAGQLTVNTAGYLYVTGVSSSGTAAVSSMTIYIAPQASPNNPTCTIVLTYSTTSSSWTWTVNGASTGTCSLGSGTYYIHLYVSPNLPVTSSSTESITVNFGYNTVSGTAIPIP